MRYRLTLDLPHTDYHSADDAYELTRGLPVTVIGWDPVGPAGGNPCAVFESDDRPALDIVCERKWGIFGTCALEDDERWEYVSEDQEGIVDTDPRTDAIVVTRDASAHPGIEIDGENDYAVLINGNQAGQMGVDAHDPESIALALVHWMRLYYEDLGDASTLPEHFDDAEDLGSAMDDSIRHPMPDATALMIEGVSRMIEGASWGLEALNELNLDAETWPEAEYEAALEALRRASDRVQELTIERDRRRASRVEE